VRERRWAPVAAILLGLLGTVALQKVLALTVAAAWPPGDVMSAVSAADEARPSGSARR